MKDLYLSFLALICLIYFSDDVHSQVSKLKTFPDIPGRDSSKHYTCRVREAGSDQWKPSFVLQTMSKPDVTKEDQQTTTKYTEALAGWTASWISFEFSGTSVVVEISKNSGEPIQKAMVRPVGHASAAEIIDGKAYVRFDEPANVNVDIDGQMEDTYTGMGYNGPPIHTISIFANPVYHEPDTTNSNVYALEPGEAIPQRSAWDTLYFTPGIHEIGVPHIMESYESYYIPGDAVVHGTLRSSWGTSDITVYGSGTLSGEKITRAVYGDEESRPIHGSGQSAKFAGIVIPDPAYHTVIYDNSSNSPQNVNIFDNLKILGWRVNGDGIHTFRNGEVVNCFIRTQDDASYYSRTVKIHNSVFWNDWNGAVVRIVKGDEVEGTSSFEDNVVIYHRANWHYWDGGRVIAFRDAGPGKTIKNVLVKNILIEDPFPAFPPFWFTMDPEGDGTKEQVMENVRIEKVYQEHPGVRGDQDSQRGKPRNTMMGLNAKNKFSNITFKHCYYNGKWLGSFEDGDFKVNEFIENITFRDTSTFYISLKNTKGGTVYGSGAYQYGNEVTIKAFSNLGYRFAGWTTNSGDTISNDPLYTFIINDDIELTANFVWLANTKNIVFATNCGGLAYEASDGTPYATDNKFVNGYLYYEEFPVANTLDDELYHTGRYGKSFGYEIPVENGSYELSLHFAEVVFSTPESRVFNVAIEGSARINKLDIYADAGKHTAYVLTYPVTVNDGELNIDLTASINNATISGIKVAIPSEKDPYQLSTNASNGTITLIPEGGSYDSLQTVILTANPDLGYAFTGWSNDISGASNPTSIIMDGDKTVTANFEALPGYKLETNATNGQIVLDPEGGVYSEGDTVILTAIADDGYEFSNWEGDLSGLENPTSIIMDADKNVSAVFKIIFGTGELYEDKSTKTALAQNYPNPFTHKTTIPYTLGEACHVKLTVYNSMGQVMISLVNKYQEAGSYAVALHPRDKEGDWLPAGLYIVQMITNKQALQTIRFVYRK